MKTGLSIEEDDWENQHRKQTWACVTVETKDVAKRIMLLCWMFQCSQNSIVPYCRPSSGRLCFAKYMKL